MLMFGISLLILFAILGYFSFMTGQVIPAIMCAIFAAIAFFGVFGSIIFELAASLYSIFFAIVDSVIAFINLVIKFILEVWLELA